MSIYKKFKTNSATLDAAIIAELRDFLKPDEIISDIEQMSAYAVDELKIPHIPDLVVQPSNVSQIQALMLWAKRHSIPIVPRGTGTGLSGGALANRGGVILSMVSFNQILEINRTNQYAVVEPGVINLDLQQVVEKEGLFYPPDPASWDSCCIGGNVAEDSGGPRCYKYGTTRNYVMQLEAVLADGSLITCGARTRKCVTGYSMRDLLIGSEGTLAIITKIVLRLISKPAAVRTMLALLPDFDIAAKIVGRIATSGITPCALEFMDDVALDLVRNRIPLKLPAECRSLLLLEVDGPEEFVDDESLRLGELCIESAAIDVLYADSQAKRNSLWDVRRSLSGTTRELFKRKLSEDVAVPIDKLSDYLRRIKQVGDQFGLTILGYGHLGDGNVHTNILSQNSDKQTYQQMWECVKQIFDIAIDLGGTLSAEHGIGCYKQPYIEMELAANNLQIQMGIKKQFDPDNILNPGKIFPWKS
jgi:glycolate oxidase